MTWDELSLLPHHRELLEAAAVTPEVAAGRVFSVTPDMTDWAGYLGQLCPLPALVFCWTSPLGVTEYQARPDVPITDDTGRPLKYVFRKGMTPILWQLATGTRNGPLWIVEGTKQSLAAASWCPSDVAVYGIAGCRSWSSEGRPIGDLEVADGREVIIWLDADATSNRAVFDAGTKLAEALRQGEGAASVKFARLPGGRDAGLDDLLGPRPADRRRDYLLRIADDAKAKPADKQPTVKQKLTESWGRPTLVVTGDRLQVMNEIGNHLRAAWDGSYLFSHGGVLSRLVGNELEPVDKDSFGAMVQRAIRTVAEAPNGEWRDGEPTATVLAYVLSESHRGFAPVEKVSRAPFVRNDGSICQSPGYDPESQVVMVADDGFERVEVPDDPTADEIRSARKLLVDDWLGDMPFEADTDRANALALVLTPMIRGMAPRVPLAVIDGLGPGVGKNLLADCLSILATGEVCDPKPYTDDENEQRKMLTAAFRAGGDLFVFDEAHELGGRALARALTAEYYSDRILGASIMARFPNRVTWVSLGNNVALYGDMARRVYRIRLAPEAANPMDRPASTFAHPDLRGWTRQMRPQLVTAALTLIRAWFAADQPGSDRGAAFGSFEAWGRIVGGICDLAGQPGFLDNLTDWRSETDAEAGYWLTHLAWTRSSFGDEAFTSRELRDRAVGNPATYEPPPGLPDPTDRGYSQSLGVAYNRMAGRWIGRYQIVKAGRTQGHSTKWTIRERGESGDLNGGNPAEDPDTLQQWSGSGDSYESRQDGQADSDLDHTHGESWGARGPSHDSPRTLASTGDAHTYVWSSGGPHGPGVPIDGYQTAFFDIETGNADELHTYGPGFVRLAGLSAGTGDVELTTDPDALVNTLSNSRLVVAHNGMDFDLVALARYHGLDLWDLVSREAVCDTLLLARHLDPPIARAKGRARRRYDLDSLAERFGIPGKAGDLKAMAKAHGGYDQIPIDDPDYRTYLTRDVELQTEVFHRLTEQLDAKARTYLAREHKVAALAARLGLNGFAVDVDLLDRRLAEGNARKAEIQQRLNAEHGIPLADAKGKLYLSPLSTKAGKAALEARLVQLGVSPDDLPRTAKTGALSLTGDVMAELAAGYPTIDHPYGQVITDLCAMVAAVTGERTIYQTADSHLDRDSGRVHPRVSMDQSTGRWSLWLTVMGKRGGRHTERDIMRADPGHVLLSIDYAQVDARAVAAHCQDPAYMELFTPGRDLHAEIALRVWGDASRREDAKPLGHGWNYGMGVARLAEHTGLGMAMAEQYDRAMREQFPGLVAWKRQIAEVAASGQMLNNGFGRPMRPDPQRAWTQGPAFMGQGGARDLMMEGLLRLPVEYHPYLRAVVHDEVIASVPADIAEDVERGMIDAMTFEWAGVPIVADAGRRSESWGKCYEH